MILLMYKRLLTLSSMILNRKIAEVVGWYGTVAIVLGYALVSFGTISADSWIFQALNLSGALGIIVISLVKRVRQSVALNLFWGTIALIALVRIATK